ncbi:DUF938 domain-containing protein [Robbsia sp. Bb-Pol-6]|uniref:DUF938 domain-containing protein n=1 Tax=Robbsia betulipollinis TaxID=2981849 RepID=A0ABT3ZGV1_9BURK|nr:DUF938 domain-containing protein [Robbsia betulipollinis]MCY0385756.1 DUF938 domain-containing protein [Robbsia betulipollinis]
MRSSVHSPMTDGPRRRAPAVARNRDPILAVLKRVLPAAGTVLEIAGGTGEHAVHFASGLPGVTWLASDPDAASLASIAAWRHTAGLPNLLPPIALDVEAPRWDVPAGLRAVVCINMIHIAPWSATQALFAGAARHLEEKGVLFLYGPYRRDGAHTAPSNAAFDLDLRGRDPRWGIRDLEAVRTLAAAAGFAFVEEVPMPANNLSLVFRRQG